jgi:hypothetical protein
VKGQIVRDTFVVSTLGESFPLPIVDAAADHRGPYVSVNQAEYTSAAGVRLRVAPDYTEGADALGAEANFDFGPDLRPAMRAELRRQGIELESVTLLNPPSRSLALFFDSDGQVNGTASVFNGLGPSRNARRPSG